jgi:hypothetical protein
LLVAQWLVLFSLPIQEFIGFANGSRHLSESQPAGPASAKAAPPS